MKSLSTQLTLATLALAVPFMATEASAKVKTVKHHFVQGKFEDHPVMEMKYANGNWKWTNKGKTFKPRVKLYFKSSGYKVDRAYLYTDKGKAGLWSLPEGYKTREYEKLVNVSIGKSVLSKNENLARSVCASSGGAKKVIKDVSINTTFVAEGSVGYTDAKASSNPMRLKVVCHSKVPNGNNNGSDTSAFKFAVTKVKLFTIPAKPKCRQPVKLIAELQSNRGGNAKFKLIRGDGEQQSVNIAMGRTSSGFKKKWSKSYIFNKTTHRKYMVTVIGSKKSTQWIPLKVNCY